MLQGTRDKGQGASYKGQGASYKAQVTSYKAQVTRRKLQVIRHKLQVIRTFPLATFPLFLLFATCYLLLATCYLLNSAHAGVESTRHNLSTSGPGPIKATTETQVCIFCHTPHGSISTPLWNHTLSPPGTNYVVPLGGKGDAWNTLLSTPANPPDGDSRLCLSCHDGTVAIGAIVNLGGTATTVSMQDSGAGYITPEGMLSEQSPGYIGTNLSGHHPVSIEVNQSLLNDKDAQCKDNKVAFRVCFPERPIKLTPTGNEYGSGPSTGIGVQCSSCHDAHENTNPKFLRVPSEDLLCIACHPLCSSGCP